MSDLSEYNVVGGLLGLGHNILLEIMSEMTLPQDVQQFVIVCRKINQLLQHPRYPNIIQSIIQITPAFIIKEAWQGRSNGNKFIHSDEYGQCVIAIDPIIKEGIVRIEIVFENNGVWRSMGIAEASCSFAAGEWPQYGGNKEKTVRYWDNGDLYHRTNGAIRNQFYSEGQRISAVVDMTTNPRKVVFYVNDIEQPNFVIEIPSEIRFWASNRYESSSFTVTKFERLNQFTSQGVIGSKALEWGKVWKK
ncbi:MAG: hypothetical protein EZS28_039809 [Streblomastix strix]|uniref:B30.2/SPRY domain-containing protein n=1 Tax=Streblomastix strix TaxID=222440 RepID=A0A5J4U2S4_9EUKA|nr:MAG: hypothetical protein EZS28_039809 [Streblomastix strix]